MLLGMSDVAMPRLSDSMEEGTILKWLKADGTEVLAGEDLVEIETDKANMTYQAEAAGVLTIVAAEGESLAVGATIARLGDGAAREPVLAAVAARPTTAPPPPSRLRRTAPRRPRRSPAGSRASAASTSRPSREPAPAAGSSRPTSSPPRRPPRPHRSLLSPRPKAAARSRIRS